jgi:hypothetical protein
LRLCGRGELFGGGLFYQNVGEIWILLQTWRPWRSWDCIVVTCLLQILIPGLDMSPITGLVAVRLSIPDYRRYAPLGLGFHVDRLFYRRYAAGAGKGFPGRVYCFTST